MIENAQKHKDFAEADGSSDYYYWDGYINALEAISSYDLEDDWWNSIK